MNDPDNWDLEDSLNRIGTVARKKYYEWWRCLNDKHNGNDLYDMAIKIYFENRHATRQQDKPVEALAELADRKGKMFIAEKITKNWCIGVIPIELKVWPIEIEFIAPTYQECELKAREYLSALPDAHTEGGKEQ